MVKSDISLTLTTIMKPNENNKGNLWKNFRDS